MYLPCTSPFETTSGSQPQASAKSASNCSCRERTVPTGRSAFPQFSRFGDLAALRLSQWVLERGAIQLRMCRESDARGRPVSSKNNYRLSKTSHEFRKYVEKHVLDLLKDKKPSPTIIAIAWPYARFCGPQAALRDSHLYEFLALVDAIRDGRARERKIAERELVHRLRATHG